jgi:hypothetical protein
MEQHYLSKRANWQNEANKAGAKNESSIVGAFREILNPDEFEVVAHPKWFSDQIFLEQGVAYDPVLEKKPESPVEGDIWYDEEKKCYIRQYGKSARKAKETFILDVGILHRTSGKRYVIECKHQSDAGNAHERACKFMAPGMIELIQDALGVEYHPIGYIFEGSLADEGSYRREILSCAGKKLGQHVHFIRKGHAHAELKEWFDKVVRPLLCLSE